MVSGASGTSGDSGVAAGLVSKGVAGRDAGKSEMVVSGCGWLVASEEHAKLSHAEGCWVTEKIDEA